MPRRLRHGFQRNTRQCPSPYSRVPIVVQVQLEHARLRSGPLEGRAVRSNLPPHSLEPAGGGALYAAVAAENLQRRADAGKHQVRTTDALVLQWLHPVADALPHPLSLSPPGEGSGEGLPPQGEGRGENTGSSVQNRIRGLDGRPPHPAPLHLRRRESVFDLLGRVGYAPGLRQGSGRTRKGAGMWTP